MEKSYDRIEWDFLWIVLSKLGFPRKWVDWIKACVTTISYLVKVNYNTTDYFFPSRGLRQGDPLSPYLFIICMDVFVNMLSRSSMMGSSRVGFKLTLGTNEILGLMFANDSLLFCKAIISFCNYLKQIIKKFCTFSGQLVNFHKSTIVFSKLIPNSRRDALSGVFNMKKSTSLSRYLGAHFSSFTPNKQDYTKIMQKNESRISL